MNNNELAHYNNLYEQHLTNLKLQGKRPATIDAYARAVRRISHHFDCCPDTLTTVQLKMYFASLMKTHSWSTIKLPDIMTPYQVSQLISHTHQLRYQIFFLTLYSMGLRLCEGLNLTVNDIDASSMQVHIRDGKGGKDRFIPLPKRTLHALRAYWQTHRHHSLLFPGKGRHLNTPMDRGGAQKAMKQVIKQCGINKQVSPHSLRHCFATHLLDQGVDLRSLQVLLGHASLNTTARYTRMTQINRRDAALAINQMTEALTITWEAV